MSKLKLLNILNESRYTHEVFEEEDLYEDYPERFDINQFANIRSYAGKLRYAEEHLGKPLGSGSSRVVYRVDQNKVLKLAKNQKGIQQNEAEINWSGDMYYQYILAKIFEYDRDNSLWVEMELAFKPKLSDFKRLWGIDFRDLNTYLRNFEQEQRGRRAYFHIDPEKKEILDNNEDVDNIKSIMMDGDLTAGDLARMSSWGLVHREDGDRLVLIDFGLTNDIYSSSYQKR